LKGSEYDTIAEQDIEREVNSTIWDGDEDVLDLSILFGEKKYKPEKWD